MRLIDADALRAQMYHEAFETDTDMQRWDGGCWIRYKMFENTIDNAPTIEPQRMRGRWNELKPQAAGYWQCSACGFPSEAFAAAQLYKFCPNCGAKMEGTE